VKGKKKEKKGKEFLLRKFGVHKHVFCHSLILDIEGKEEKIHGALKHTACILLSHLYSLIWNNAVNMVEN
jgi:hypothetical protein